MKNVELEKAEIDYHNRCSVVATRLGVILHGSSLNAGFTYKLEEDSCEQEVPHFVLIELERLYKYIGSEYLMSDFRNAAHMRAEINRLRAIVSRRDKRCEECGGELSSCGGMTSDGPVDDCKVCILRRNLEEEMRENRRLCDTIEKLHIPLNHIRTSDGQVLEVLGELPLTADGCVPGDCARVFVDDVDEVWDLLLDKCGSTAEVGSRCDFWPIEECYSTREAAEAARKARGEVRP